MTQLNDKKFTLYVPLRFFAQGLKLPVYMLKIDIIQNKYLTFVQKMSNGMNTNRDKCQWKRNILRPIGKTSVKYFPKYFIN